MTREEAKRRLLDIERCTPIHTREDVRDFEALEMAIKALSQEPIPLNDINNALGASFRNGLRFAKVEQEPCDDIVSRDAVIDAIERVRNNHAYDEIEEIQKLPSVTQKSGKWIPIPYQLDYESDAECSLCHEQFIAAMNYNYCPNCGHRMKGDNK